MKIDLCKLLGVEEGEEFKIEYTDGNINNVKYRVINNQMESSSMAGKYDGNYSYSLYPLNIVVGIKNIIKLTKKKKEFTDNELYILNNIDKKYKWIAKDKNGLICTFVSKPIKTERFWSDGWSNGESYASLEAIKNSLFTEIKWEDEEPVYIDDYVER